MSKRIKANDLSGEVTRIITGWNKELNEQVVETTMEVSQDAQDRLKVEGDFKNRSGKYRKGWKIQFTELSYGLQATIYNKEYPLTHLLESGHAKWIMGHNTGEYVRAFPHIANVNEEAQEKLEKELKRRLSDL